LRKAVRCRVFRRTVAGTARSRIITAFQRKGKGLSMQHELPQLPYAMDALIPHISKETFEYHYGKHHQAYVTNSTIWQGYRVREHELEDIVKKSSGGVFNNAAQVWITPFSGTA